MPDDFKIKDLARRVKEKYPEYAEVDDVELATRVASKYPEYGEYIGASPAATSADNILAKMRGSVMTQESGGNQKVQNPRTSATGLFQVMPANIPKWTRKYHGKALSQQEFANDRQAQENVFKGEMGKYVNRALKLSGGDEDKAIRMAAAAWYGGEGNIHNYDANWGGKGSEPTFREYTTSVLNRIKKNGGMPSLAPQANPLVEQGVIDPTVYTPVENTATAPIDERQWDTLPDGTAVVPQVAPPQSTEQIPHEAPHLTQATDPQVEKAYADFLKQTGLPNTQESVAEFNLANQASVDVANAENKKAYEMDKKAMAEYNAKLPKQPVPTKQTAQNAQKPQEPPVNEPSQAFKDSIVEFRYDTGKGDYAEQDKNATTTKIASLTGVDYSTVRDFLEGHGWYDRNDTPTEREQQAKGDVTQKRRIPASVQNQIVEYATRRKANETTLNAAREKVLAENTGLDTNPEMLDILAAKEAGFIGKYEAERKMSKSRDEYIDWLVAKGYARADAVEKAFGVKQEDGKPMSAFDWALAKNPLANLIVGERKEDTYKEVRKSILDDIEQYGSLANATKAYKQQEEERKLSVMGQPTEALKTAARYITKIPSTIADTVAMATDLDPVTIGYEYVTGNETGVRKALLDVGEQWRNAVDKDLALMQNPTYKNDFVANELAEGLAQFAVQMIGAPLTGGASLALPLMEGSTAQSREADKAGADRATRVTASAVGAILAVPDVLLKAKYLKSLTGTGKLAFIENLTGGLFTKLAKQFTEKEAKQITKDTVGAFIKKALGNTALGFGGEYSQERLEDVGNKALAKATYKPELTWEEVILPSAQEKRGYLAAGIAGIFGGTVETAIEKLSNDELKRGETELGKMLESDRISKTDYQRAVNKLSKEIETRIKRGTYFAKDAKIQAEVAGAEAIDNVIQEPTPITEAKSVEPEPTKVEPEVKKKPKFSDKPLKEVQAEGKKEYAGVDDFFEEAPVDIPVDNTTEQLRPSVDYRKEMDDFTAELEAKTQKEKQDYDARVAKNNAWRDERYAPVSDATLLANRDKINALETEATNLDGQIMRERDDNKKQIWKARQNAVIDDIRTLSGGRSIPTIFPKTKATPVAQKLDAVKELNKQKREALAEIEDEAKSLEAQGRVQDAKDLRDRVTAKYNAKILEAKKGVSQKAPKIEAQKTQPISVSEGKEIRPNDPIYNEAGKVGVYQEIEHNGKVLKRVQTVKGTPTISNTIEYKEGNWTKGVPDDTMMQATNASGESSASLEAQSRLKGEQSRGEYRVVVDTRSGNERKLFGVDAVDHRPQPYESVEWRGGNRDGEVIDRGANARPYQRKTDDTMMMVAWHGSPHKFDKFDSSKIGTGEGAQAYGHGLYFAGDESVADHYKKALGGTATIVTKTGQGIRRIDTKKAIARITAKYGEEVANEVDEMLRMIATGETTLQQAKRDAMGMASRSPWAMATHMLLRDATALESSGKKYKVDLKPAEDEYLLWDKPLSEQSEKVKKALAEAGFVDDKQGRKAFDTALLEGLQGNASKPLPKQPTNPLGSDIYKTIAGRKRGSDVDDWAGSEYLKSLGIRGIKYLDGTSRGKGEGSYNYVIFDDADVEITDVMQRAIDEMNKAKASFDAVKKLPTKSLVEQSNFTKNARIAEGGVIAVDQIPEIELIRRIMGEGTQFYGVMADPNKVAKFNDTLDKMIAHSDNPNLKRLKRLVNTALKHDGTVIFAMSEETVPEEKAHRALYGNRQNDRASQIAPDVQKSIAESDVFKNATKFQEAYKGFSEAGKVEEFAVKSSLGQWGDLGITSEADKYEAMRQARNFYRSYAETNKGEGTADDVINRLATEIAYAEEYQNQEVRGNEKEDKKSDESSVVEPPRRASDKADVEAGESKPDGVKLKSRTPGKSGLEFDEAKAEQAKTDGKKVAAISKLTGIEDYYTPQGNAETEANVDAILGEMTFDEAITQAMNAPPSPEASRVMAREAERLVGVAESYRQQGKGAEQLATLQRVGEIIGALKLRQLGAGREVEIQKMLRPLTPEAAVITAEYLYQMAFDKPLSIKQREDVFAYAQENQRLLGELATAEMKLAEANRVIAEIDNNVPEKKPANHQEALLNKYQKRKPIILAELKARFPNSPVFDESPSMMMAIGNSANQEVAIDPKTAELLKEYAIGQILTDRSYETVIRELKDISGASDEQVKDIHAQAADEVRGAKTPQSEEAKKRIKIRQEHYAEADKRSGKLDAKAIATARKSIAELQRKIDEQDLATVRKQPTNSATILELREQQKALRKELRNLRKANTQTVKGLSRYGQKALNKNPEDIELAIAVDLLSNDKPKSMESVILTLQNDYGFAPPEAKGIAQDAKQLIKELKAEDARTRDKAKGISEEQREVINAKRAEQMKAANRLNNFLNKVTENPNVIKRFNDDFRIKLVANWGTQIFNAVQVGTVATPAQILLDVIELGLRKSGVNIGEATDVRVRDLLLPYNYILSANRQIAEQALAQYPDLFFEVHKGLLGDIPIEPLKLADTKTGLSKVAHQWFDANAKYNEFATKWSGAKMFEMHFRNSVIASSFDQAIRKQTNGKQTLESVMKDGKLTEYITYPMAKRAAKRAMDVTFASEIDDPIGKGLKHVYDKVDNYLPVLLNPITYARFMYSTSKQAVINPLMFGAMDSTKLGGEGYSTRSIAKGALAYSTLIAAGAILSAIGGDDDKWYTLYPLGKNGPIIDIRRSYPLAAYFYIAHNVLQKANDKPMDTDILGGLLSLETEYYQHGAPMEFLGSVADVARQKKDIGDLGESTARLLGGYLSGFTRAAKPLRDLWAQVDADERAYREDPEGAKDKFINELSRSIPGIIRMSGQKKQTDIDGNVLEQPFPIGRIFGVNVVHPDFTREAGTKATQWANRLWQKEYGKMTPDEKRAYTLRTQLKKAVRAGKLDVNSATTRINQYVSEGRLSKGSGSRLKSEIKSSQLAAKIKYEFGDNEQDIKILQTVWAKATDAEKQEIRKILNAKDSVSAKTKALFK